MKLSNISGFELCFEYGTHLIPAIINDSISRKIFEGVTERYNSSQSVDKIFCVANEGNKIKSYER